MQYVNDLNLYPMKSIKRTKDPGTEFVIRHLKKIVRRSMQEEPVTKKQEPVINDEGCKVFTYDSGAALKALELLGKHLGMFSDKKPPEITPGGFDIIVGGKPVEGV